MNIQEEIKSLEGELERLKQEAKKQQEKPESSFKERILKKFGEILDQELQQGTSDRDSRAAIHKPTLKLRLSKKIGPDGLTDTMRLILSTMKVGIEYSSEEIRAKLRAMGYPRTVLRGQQISQRLYNVAEDKSYLKSRIATPEDRIIHKMKLIPLKPRKIYWRIK